MARKVGIGIQDFEKIITQDCFYVDKTIFIKKLVGIARCYINYPSAPFWKDNDNEYVKFVFFDEIHWEK